jgi:hypothetical protein
MASAAITSAAKVAVPSHPWEEAGVATTGRSIAVADSGSKEAEQEQARPTTRTAVNGRKDATMPSSTTSGPGQPSTPTGGHWAY